MKKKNHRKMEHEQDKQREEGQEVDARVLGQILAAQNVIFALPDATRIAEFYSQTLLSIPGIAACRVCLANQSIQAGQMENAPCAACEASRRGGDPGSIVPANPNFNCNLINQPDVRVIAIDSYQHHFGFFVFNVDQTAGFDAYQPFIKNLSNYVAITFDNRLQKELLESAQHELERRVKERTSDLTTANEELQREITERQRTEKALRESEEQVRQLFDASPVAMILSQGRNEHVEWINNKFIELFGYIIEDMPDVEHWWTLAYEEETYREEVKRRWREDVEQAIQDKGQIKPMEAKVRCRNGSYRHIEFRLSSIGDKHLVTFVDLTERKQAEIALRERERHSQSLLRLSRKLEQVQTYSDVLNAAQDEVREIIGYQNLWAYLFTSDNKQAKALFAKGPMADQVMSEDGTGIITIQGDRMMEEFLKTTEIQVIEDAQIDERTDKNIAVKMRNRTLVHVPILLFDQLMGSIGMGTFGDEGIRVPTAAEREYLVALASHMAVTIDRIHLLERRNQMEQELIAREREFRTLAEYSPDNIARYDVSGRTIYVNPTLERTLGRPASEMLGTFPAEAGFIVEAKEYQEKLAGVARTGEQDDMDLVLPDNGDGLRYHNIRFVAERGLDGAITGIQAIGRDITERKRAEQALRASEWRYHEIFDNVLDGLYLLQVTEAGRFCVMEVNPAVERITGISGSSLPGKTLEEILPAEIAEMVNDTLRHCIEMGHPMEEEAEFDLPVGRRNIHSTLIPAQDETGRVRRIIGISRDITEHKLAENALRESEEKYRLLHENAGVGIGYYKPDGQVISYNQLAASHMQGKPEDFEGKSIYEIFSREEADLYMERLRSSLTADSSIAYEDHLELPSGNKWFLSVFTKIRDAQQNAIGVQIISQDITEQKQAEEALRASENRFRVLSENAFVGIYIIQDGQLSYVNSTLAEIFGYTPTELTGAQPALVIHPDDQALVSENIRRRIVGEIENIHYEFRGRCKNGEIKNIEVLGGRVDLGGQPAIIGNLMDITNRKRAEEEIARSLAAEKKARRVAEILREANESLSRTLHLDSVLQNLLNYLMHLVPYDSANVMLREGNFHFRVVALRGYESWTDLEAAKKLVFDIRTIPSLNELVALQKSTIITNTYEYPGWQRVPGTEHVVSWMGIPIIADGQVIGLYSVDKVKPAFFTDEHRFLAEGLAAQAAVAIQNTRLHDQITRSNVELEQRVASRTAQLEEANKELEAFAYSVSHDLRAPLRHIDGFIEMLQKRMKTNVDDKSQHYMDVIADSARRMGTLIDDLLSFSRMGRTEMFTSQVDLNDLIQDIVDEFKPETTGRNIQWKIPSLPPVTGDRAMLRIALMNLIANALKFTRSRTIAQIEIGYEKNKTEMVIFVRDNGVGFDMAYADKLFGVFQRLHRQEDFEGTGIGLANVYRVIHRHGGRTWAESKVDQGATFYFSLPISQVER